MKLKKEHFDLFKATSECWIKNLGLVSWDIHFNFVEIENFAQCTTWYRQRSAIITLNSGDYEPLDDIFKSDKDAGLRAYIKKAAVHEVLELLLSPLGAFARSRTFDELDLNKEEHTIIRTLENYLTETTF